MGGLRKLALCQVLLLVRIYSRCSLGDDGRCMQCNTLQYLLVSCIKIIEYTAVKGYCRQCVVSFLKKKTKKKKMLFQMLFFMNTVSVDFDNEPHRKWLGIVYIALPFLMLLLAAIYKIVTIRIRDKVSLNYSIESPQKI